MEGPIVEAPFNNPVIDGAVDRCSRAGCDKMNLSLPVTTWAGAVCHLRRHRLDL